MADGSPAKGRIGRAYVIVALTVAGWLVVAGVFFFGHHIMEFAARLLGTMTD